MYIKANFQTLTTVNNVLHYLNIPVTAAQVFSPTDTLITFPGSKLKLNSIGLLRNFTDFPSPSWPLNWRYGAKKKRHLGKCFFNSTVFVKKLITRVFENTGKIAVLLTSKQVLLHIGFLEEEVNRLFTDSLFMHVARKRKSKQNHTSAKHVEVGGGVCKQSKQALPRFYPCVQWSNKNVMRK